LAIELLAVVVQIVEVGTVWDRRCPRACSSRRRPQVSPAAVMRSSAIGLRVLCVVNHRRGFTGRGRQDVAQKKSAHRKGGE
jgi:hypothetical protein